MKSVSRILLAAALAVAFVVSAIANDRENFAVGRLQVETDITATDGSLTISNATLASPIISGASVAGSTLGSTVIGSADVTTNLDFTLQTITLTNGGSLTFNSTWVELNNVGDPALVTTNPVSVAFASDKVGRLLLVQGATANSNSIHLAESSTFILAATNLTVTPEDSIIFQIVATNKIRQLTAISVN